MVNNAKVNSKPAGLRQSKRLHRSFAVLKDDLITPMGNKDEARVKNSQLASERPLGKAEGLKDLDPTRYGDWERKGRCIDF